MAVIIFVLNCTDLHVNITSESCRKALTEPAFIWHHLYADLRVCVNVNRTH